MKMHNLKAVKRRLVFAMLPSAILFARGNVASGQLFSSINFNETVYANYDNPPQGALQSQVVQSTAPFQQTVSVNDGVGGEIARSYDIYDDGSTAGILISSSGSVTEYNLIAETSVVGEPDDDIFTLSEPTSYSLTMEQSGSGTGVCTILGTGWYINTGPTSLPQTFSGTADAGLFDFSAEWGMGDNGTNTLSGSQTFSLTFNAIPEPTSALLAGLPAATLLLRRRQKPKLG